MTRERSEVAAHSLNGAQVIVDYLIQEKEPQVREQIYQVLQACRVALLAKSGSNPPGLLHRDDPRCVRPAHGSAMS